MTEQVINPNSKWFVLVRDSFTSTAKYSAVNGQFPLLNASAGNHGSCRYSASWFEGYNDYDSLQAHLTEGEGHCLRINGDL